MATDQDHITQARKVLTSRTLRLRWRYYDGTQPRLWLTPKLRSMFRALADSMDENYCGLAIHTRATRLEVTGFAGDGSAAAEELWTADRWPTRQSDWFRWALVYGYAYLIVADDDGDRTIAPNRPTLVWHEPSVDDPSRVEVAVKQWFDGDVWRSNVYDDEEIRRYVARGTDQSRSKPPAPDAYMRDSDDEGGPHGFDRCPVIPTYAYGYEAPVLIDQIASPQDRINKLAANKFVAAEFGAFRQRIFFTTQGLADEDVEQTPDTAVVLDPGDPNNPARMAESTPTDLANYDNAKAAEVDGLFTIALLPRHLRVAGTAQPPSGAAIKADEGPLVEALYDHQREFGAALTDAFGLLGIDADPVWRSPEILDETAAAATVRAFVDSGVPWQDAVKRYAGWTDEDVQDLTPAAGPAVAQANGTAGNATGAALLQAFSAAPAEG